MSTCIEVGGHLLPAGTRVLPTDRGTTSGGGGAQCTGRSHGRAARGTAPSSARPSGPLALEASVTDAGNRADIVVRVHVPGWPSVPVSSCATSLGRNALQPRPHTFKACVSAWTDESSDDSGSPVRTAADATSLLLVDLGALLFRQQCSSWQRLGKAWTSESKIAGAIRYFLKGLRVGQRPVFDGICALEDT